MLSSMGRSMLGAEMSEHLMSEMAKALLEMCKCHVSVMFKSYWWPLSASSAQVIHLMWASTTRAFVWC